MRPLLHRVLLSRVPFRVALPAARQEGAASRARVREGDCRARSARALLPLPPWQTALAPRVPCSRSAPTPTTAPAQGNVFFDPPKSALGATVWNWYKALSPPVAQFLFNRGDSTAIAHSWWDHITHKAPPRPHAASPLRPGRLLCVGLGPPPPLGVPLSSLQPCGSRRTSGVPTSSAWGRVCRAASAGGSKRSRACTASSGWARWARRTW